MARYVAYNKIYVKGRASGRSYRVEDGNTEEEAKRKAIKENVRWNKWNKNRNNISAKLFEIKKRRR